MFFRPLWCQFQLEPKIHLLWYVGATNLLQDIIFCILSASLQLILHNSDFVMPKSKNSLKYDRFSHFTPIIFIVCLKFNLYDAIHIQKFFRILYVAYLLPPYNIYDILVMLRHFKVTFFLIMAVFLYFIALAMHKMGHFSKFWLIKMRLMTNIPWNSYFTSFSMIMSYKCIYYGFLRP